MKEKLCLKHYAYCFNSQLIGWLLLMLPGFKPTEPLSASPCDDKGYPIY